MYFNSSAQRPQSAIIFIALALKIPHKRRLRTYIDVDEDGTRKIHFEFPQIISFCIDMYPSPSHHTPVYMQPILVYIIRVKKA